MINICVHSDDSFLTAIEASVTLQHIVRPESYAILITRHPYDIKIIIFLAFLNDVTH